MSTAEPGTIASPREPVATPFLQINPDIIAAFAFAALGILLAAYAAIAFPPSAEVWTWS
jgi:hypothetical protein